MEALIEEYKEKGWIAKKGRKHWKLQHPVTGEMVFTSSTPRTGRGVDNARSMLKRKHNQAQIAIDSQSILTGDKNG